MSKCKSCGAEIKWIKTKTGKPMPVNPQKILIAESKNNCNTTIITEDGQIKKGDKFSDIRDIKKDGWEGFESHFATCPNANSHRQGRS